MDLGQICDSRLWVSIEMEVSILAMNQLWETHINWTLILRVSY